MPPDWNTFFADYAAASGDPARVAAFYADAFIGAGPRGSGSFKDDEALLEWREREPWLPPLPVSASRSGPHPSA